MGNDRRFDLEERTFVFARDVLQLVKKLPRTVSNTENVKQLVRSSGSIGANYIEANEALGKKDFAMRIKICRKEAKETAYWLRLIDIRDDNDSQQCKILCQEAIELMKIFGAILEKTK